MNGALVVGGSGLIGHALMERLPEVYGPVIGTVRRIEAGNASSPVILDLSKHIPDQPLLGLADKVRTAFLCAAIPRFEDCERDREGSFLVNVSNIVRIAELLVGRGVKIVFLSTNAVFNGDNAYEAESSIPTTATEYGRQKAEAEKRLRALGGLEPGKSHVIIARLTKVLSARMPLIRGWVESLKRGEAIQAFDDLVLAPVSLSYATKALIRLSTSAAPGTYHVSGARDVTYHDFAVQLAEALGCPKQLVSPVKTPVGGGWQIIKPRYSAVAMKKTEKAISTAPQNLKDVAKDIVEEWRNEK